MGIKNTMRLNTVNVLTTLRDLMVSSWVKGSFRDIYTNKMCLMGGVDEAVARLNNGTGLTAFTNAPNTYVLHKGAVEDMGNKNAKNVLNPKTPKDFAIKAARYLQAAASKYRGARVGVVSFNDSNATEKKDILAVCDIAIKAAKRRHLPQLA